MVDSVFVHNKESKVQLLRIQKGLQLQLKLLKEQIKDEKKRINQKKLLLISSLLVLMGILSSVSLYLYLTDSQLTTLLSEQNYANGLFPAVIASIVLSFGLGFYLWFYYHMKFRTEERLKYYESLGRRINTYLETIESPPSNEENEA